MTTWIKTTQAEKPQGSAKWCLPPRGEMPHDPEVSRPPHSPEELWAGRPPPGCRAPGTGSRGIRTELWDEGRARASPHSCQPRSLFTENWLVWSRGCVFYKQQLQENQKIRPCHCLHGAGSLSLIVLVAPDSRLQRENSPNQPLETQLSSLPKLLT